MHDFENINEKNGRRSLRKIIISVTLIVLSLCLIAIGLTFDQELEYNVIIFILKWQKQFTLF